MEVEYEVYILIVLIIFIAFIPPLRKTINIKCNSLIMSHILAFIYLFIRILYINDSYKIYRYEEIETKYKYYGLLTNSLILNDYISFYISFTVIYICSMLVEYQYNKMTVLGIWFATNVMAPLLIWLHYYEIKKDYDFYVLAYNYGLVSNASALLIYVMVICIVDDINRYRSQQLLLTLLFIGIYILLNVINLGFYDDIYNVINVNIGYLVGLIVAMINIISDYD